MDKEEEKPSSRIPNYQNPNLRHMRIVKRSRRTSDEKDRYICFYFTDPFRKGSFELLATNAESARKTAEIILRWK